MPWRTGGGAGTGVGGVERALGAVQGKLESLIQEFQDERHIAREDRALTLRKLNLLEDEMILLKAQIKPISSQMYSNKTEIDGVKGVLKVVQTIYSRAMGVFWVFSAIMGMIFTGIWWTLGHWGEVYEAMRVILTPKGGG